MNLTLKQIMDPALVDAFTLDVPTGSHEHELDPGLAKTRPGGLHTHVFRTDTGDLLVTDVSGSHEHTLHPFHEKTDEFYTSSCGEHVHTVTLADGTVLKTEIDGWHTHTINSKTEPYEAEAAGEPEGQHRHRLVLPNGAVLVTLMPGDDLEDLSREAGNAAYRVNATKGYPQDPLGVGKAEVIVKGTTPGVRLTLGFDAAKYTVDLDVARKGIEVESAEEAAAGFGLTGYRCLQPILGVTCKAKVSKRAPRVDSAKTVDILSITWGLQTDVMKEVFLAGELFTGVLVLRKNSDGDWHATLDRVATPQVLCKGNPLPPRGFSALPVSLAKATPPHLSFWQTTASELAKSQRDTLAVSRYFAAENLAQVAKELRKVERKTVVHLYQPATEKTELRTYANEVAKLLPEAAKPVVVKGDTWQSAACPPEGVLIIEASAAEEVAELVKSDDRYLVIAPDNAETRKSLARLGQVFKLDHPDAADKIMVASYDLTLAKSADAAISLPLGAGEETPVLAVNVDKALVAASKLDNQRFIRKADTAEEERYTLGIVLEPEVVDAQNDIYDAATIRKAAHLYMERYQNVGLQHKEIVYDDRVRLVESYLAPCDMSVNGRAIKAGTWLMGHRYNEALWKDVKAGKYTGLSIGGWADRTPADVAKALQAAEQVKPVESQAEQELEQPTEVATIDSEGNSQ